MDKQSTTATATGSLNDVSLSETVWQVIQSRADLTPDAGFLRDEADRQLTFAQFCQKSEAIANFLQDKGVNQDCVIAWQLPTGIPAALIAAALTRLGVTQLPVLPMYREAELAHLLGALEIDIIITQTEWNGFGYLEQARRMQVEFPQLQVLDVEQLIELDREVLLPRDSWKSKAWRPSDDVRWLFTTSGTTSMPKIVMHEDASILSTAKGVVSCLALNSDDVVPLVFPFTHIGGIIWLVASLLGGSKVLMVSRFNSELIAFLDRCGITVGGAGTPFHQAYLRAKLTSGDQPFLSSIRCFPGGATVKPPQLHGQMQAAFGGAGIVSGYGLTEYAIATMNSVDDPDSKLALTEGRALPGTQVKILRADGASAPPWRGGGDHAPRCRAV